jgi:hypothetical protein
MKALSPIKTLAEVRTSRPIIQDFCPLSGSLERRIGQGHLRERGIHAFTTDPAPVPFAIKNHGSYPVLPGVQKRLVETRRGRTPKPQTK